MRNRDSFISKSLIFFDFFKFYQKKVHNMIVMNLRAPFLCMCVSDAFLSFTRIHNYIYSYILCIFAGNCGIALAWVPRLFS